MLTFTLYNLLKTFLVLVVSLLATSKITTVFGECDYPSNYDGYQSLKTQDHPIECATCELVINALENWLIDPTDEQSVW